MTAPRQIIPGTTQFGTRLAAAVKAKAAELVAEREAEGKTFLGHEAVLAQSPFDRPDSDEERGELDTKVACRDKWLRVEALNRVKAFLDAYRQAWVSSSAGSRMWCSRRGPTGCVATPGVPPRRSDRAELVLPPTIEVTRPRS